MPLSLFVVEDILSVWEWTITISMFVSFGVWHCVVEV